MSGDIHDLLPEGILSYSAITLNIASLWGKPSHIALISNLEYGLINLFQSIFHNKVHNIDDTLNMHIESLQNWTLCHCILPRPLYHNVIGTDIVYTDTKQLPYLQFLRSIIQLSSNGDTLMIFNVLELNNYFLQCLVTVNPIGGEILVHHVLNGCPCSSR